jgi:hypothetical protein
LLFHFVNGTNKQIKKQICWGTVLSFINYYLMTVIVILGFVGFQWIANYMLIKEGSP